jgi:sec-independent protein translocase protein TatB
MFDVGFSEILIIAVVALIVLGPERLPKAARLAGLWVRKARAQWYSVKAELERELLDEELKRSLKGSLGEIEQQLHAEQMQLRRDFQAIDASVKSGSANSEIPPPADDEKTPP